MCRHTHGTPARRGSDMRLTHGPQGGHVVHPHATVRPRPAQPPPTDDTHSHESYWGADSHLFDPDRWLDERVNKYVTPNPFIFLPFNAGPRIVRPPPPRTPHADPPLGSASGSSSRTTRRRSS